MLLFSGDLEAWFLGGVVMCGLLIPLSEKLRPRRFDKLIHFLSLTFCAFSAVLLCAYAL